MGWGRERKCAFLDKILHLHHLGLLLPVGLPNVLQWLKEEGYKEPQFLYKKADFVYKSPSLKATLDFMVKYSEVEKGLKIYLFH